MAARLSSQDSQVLQNSSINAISYKKTSPINVETEFRMYVYMAGGVLNVGMTE